MLNKLKEFYDRKNAQKKTRLIWKLFNMIYKDDDSMPENMNVLRLLRVTQKLVILNWMMS